MRSLIFLSLLCLNLFAAVDNDMDGVSDDVDNCPNTPFFELVDKTGCTTQKLTVKDDDYHYDIMLGTGYVNIDDINNDTLFSVMADFYYKDFIFTLFTQTYSQNNAYAGNDLYLFANYKMQIDAWTLKFGPGIVLPIASESSNKTDYFLNVNVNYKIDKFDFNLYYKYTFMNDALTQDIDTLSVGLGYYALNTTYLNLSYSNEKSVYKDIEDIENLTFMVNYAFNSNWFVNVRASEGLSDSASDFSTVINLGYYF
jgi:hypothetical protein